MEGHYHSRLPFRKSRFTELSGSNDSFAVVAGTGLSKTDAFVGYFTFGYDQMYNVKVDGTLETYFSGSAGALTMPEGFTSKTYGFHSDTGDGFGKS